MPARSSVRACVLATVLSAFVAAAAGQTPGAAAAAVTTTPTSNSALDRQLMLQLLIGEFELRAGDIGSAYQVVLDAARRTKDEQLYRRVVDIAWQAGFGEDALTAVRMWRADVPSSLDAQRYAIQLLVAMKRVPETIEPLNALVKLTPAADREALLSNLPRFFARAADRKEAADTILQVLLPYADDPLDGSAANVGLARALFVAQDNTKAMEYLERAQSQNPASEPAALLALEVFPAVPAAEGVITKQLKAKPSNGVRLVYARVLSTQQRYADAITQLEAVTKSEPSLAPPYLTLGALYLELRQPKDATVALERFVQLAQAKEQADARAAAAAAAASAASAPTAAAAASAPAPAATASIAGDDDDASTPERAVTQAWLMLSQAAEQQNDYKAAEAWLAKIDSPQRVLDVTARRASLMARQGKLKEARELIRKVPEKGEVDARAKLMAEVQVLRDSKQWGEANTLLASANQKFPDDVDLLYEQSMMAEKLNRMDEMERLLRKVIALKPDHPHAHNALGYSLAERNLRLPEAKALIQKALEISPGEPFITDSLGWVEYRMGNRDEALRLLKGAYQARPDPEIAAHLGEVLWVNGQRDEARRVWREGRNRDSANDVLKETLARLRVDL